MRGFCDLHVHSTFSDGTDTPTQLIRTAEALELDAVALCDHNTVAGLPEFLAAGEGCAVQAIPGIEFSSDYRDTELHILGLFIQPEHYGRINALLADFLRQKEESNLALIEKLNAAGYAVDYRAVKAKTRGLPNRASIAAELTALGYTASIKEAIHTLLSPKHGYYQPPRHPSAQQVITFIKSIGAVAVLAHPFLNLKEPALRAFLAEAIPWGLDGMETLYSDFTPELTEKAVSIASEFGLKQSGGSDYHGGNKPSISLGTGRGDLAVPTKLLELLRTE